MSWDIFNDHFFSEQQHTLVIPTSLKRECGMERAADPVCWGLKQSWQVAEMLQGPVPGPSHRPRTNKKVKAATSET